ncbi:MAG: short-chain dehydrogenase [Colwellia sp.]|jgi:NAD(P)-dependent dehydrogenase (short-subunit alcohol dehydrogenase family)|nr:MAG: short-chain dehydrogenase [Colwellia sp.]
MSKGKLKDRVAVVTGAAGGLGAEAARVLASHGAKIAIIDINGEMADKMAAEICTKGGEAIAVATDISQEASVKLMVEQVVGHFGRIDILHNNAAILSNEQREGDRDVINMDVDAWDRAMAVNLRGAMLCSKYCIPEMIKLKRGSVINVASGLGAQGDLTLSAYAASKAALIMLARSIAAQYGKQGIRANALLIGLAPAENAHKSMPAEMLQIIRDNHLTPELGTPKQIADAVAFLACDESSFVTGSTLSVDGGFGSHTPSMVAMKSLFERMGSNKM